MAETVYIIGPMRGYKDYNFPAFTVAAMNLREQGYSVISPAEMDREDGFEPHELPRDHDWNDYPDHLCFDRDKCARRDVEAIFDSDAVYLLKGYEESRNGQTEIGIAEWLGRKIWYEEDKSGAEQTIRNVKQAKATQTKGNAEPLPEDSDERKTYPLYRGLFQYFPHALSAVARHSWDGNQKHHPDKELHWDRDKSTDEEDALLRHVLEGNWEGVAWRALAKLQKELEQGGKQ